MNYPVWYLPETGGGILIALIAIVHVFISHFAVGGGLYLVWTERKGLRENSPEILEFTRRHTKFFMLLTMVFGGITGVGIWFITALVQPAAISLLIHNFVFGWAAEWVWFLVEIVALLVYYYSFGKMDSRTHQKVGWIYFIAGWLSLVLINGIIAFMLTPGDWLQDHNFWSGFFNPTFWPSMFFRSFFSFMLAGLYAFVTCAFLKDRRLKETMTRYSGKWVLTFLTLSLPCVWWYLSVLPQPARALVEGGSPTIRAIEPYALAGLLGTFILALLLTIIRPALNTRMVALLTLIPAFLLLGSFEWTREAARRPFVIHGVMYSDGVTVAQAEKLHGQSFLANSRFASVHEVTNANLSAAGEQLFKFQCYACHTIGGINNDIKVRTAGMDFPTLTHYLEKVIGKRPYMPPFLGTEKEAQALAAFIAGDLNANPVNLATLAPAESEGRQLYEENCVGCHDLSIIKDWAKDLNKEAIIDGLGRLSEFNAAMENFSGSRKEKQLLADFFSASASQGESLPGQAIFEENCIGCHDKSAPMAWARGKSQEKISAGLEHLDLLNPMMEGLSLDPNQRQAVAAWLVAETKAQGSAQ